MAEIYLPNTHESIPAVIEVGGVCYEYVETIDRDVHQEDHCWDEVTGEFNDCEACCFPTVEYGVCCTNNDPSMFVTVSGNTSDVNWLGLTWTPDESGTEKSVCASYYALKHNKRLVLSTKMGAYTLIISSKYAAQVWKIAGLSLNRGYARTTTYINGGPYATFATRTRHNQFLTLNESLSDMSNYRSSVQTIAKYDLNMISGVSKPTYNNYLLTSAFFGSHTIDGVTYSWRKGSCWNA